MMPTGITISFNLNDLMMYETTILVKNPYKVQQVSLRAYGSKSAPESGLFQMPNVDVVGFIQSLVDAIPYAKYSRRDLHNFAASAKTGKEISFEINSPSPKLHSIFIQLYKKYVDAKGG